MPIKRNIINVSNTEILSVASPSPPPGQAPSSALFQLNSSATVSAAINRTAALDSDSACEEGVGEERGRLSVRVCRDRHKHKYVHYVHHICICTRISLNDAGGARLSALGM